MARIKELEDTDPPDIAAVRSAGIYATAPGGHPTQMGGASFPTLTVPGEANAFVDARLTEGSDFLKIINDDLYWMERKLPTLDEATGSGLGARGSGLGARGSGLGARGSGRSVARSGPPVNIFVI